MNKPVKSAPLTLLIGDAAPASESALQLLLDSEPEFSVSHSGLMHGSTTGIVYRGVSLEVSMNRQNQNLSDLKNIFCNLDRASIRFGVDIGLGKHVTGGERVPAIIQALLGAARILGSALNAVATVWHPANIVSGFSYFSEAVIDYMSGGAFPVLALVNFKAEDDGTINSRGLALLSGQELQVASNDMGQSEAILRVARVAHDIAINGAVNKAVKLAGIVPDEILDLQPVPESGLLRMNIYSTADTYSSC